MMFPLVLDIISPHPNTKAYIHLTSMIDNHSVEHGIVNICVIKY